MWSSGWCYLKELFSATGVSSTRVEDIAKLTSVQAVETSVTINSSSQNYLHTHQDIHTTVYDPELFCYFNDRKWNLLRVSFPTASMLDYPGVVRRFGTGATHAIACNSDQEVGDISKIDNNTVNSFAVQCLDQFCVSKSYVMFQFRSGWRLKTYRLYRLFRLKIAACLSCLFLTKN